MWTSADLENLVREKLGDYLFVLVSNRQPYVHRYQKGRVICQRGAGGVVSALDPVMRASRGLWIAYGNGDADRRVTDAAGKIGVPPEKPSYTLKRIWLNKAEEEGYYNGYSNDTLWPLSHLTFKRPTFRKQDWDYYKSVNMKFAKAIADELGGRKAFVWIQDYHLCLLPAMLKELCGPQVITAHFWHIPWPSHEIFRICPDKKELLEGLLANDLLGFHIRLHCNNFLEAVDRELESKIDRERFSVTKGGHETLVRPYPISVDFTAISADAASPAVEETMRSLKEEFRLEGQKLILGIDRIDYTKGIPERLLALDLLLDRHPEFKEKVTLLQIGEISRIHVQKYKDINDEINAIVERINWKHSTENWTPVVLTRRHVSYEEILALYRLSSVCMVTSLHDGMNLVAKEFVSSKIDGTGVLMLSNFTGAARELTDALVVNPYDRDQCADELHRALSMPEEEAARRMQKMRETVASNNIYHWAGKILSDLLKFDFRE